jgi:hypothetical protein
VLKLIALFSGLALTSVGCGYLVAEYQKGNIKIFESLTTTNLTNTSEVVNDNSVSIKELEDQKTIREQVKADVLTELENQRLAIAKEKEAQRQLILQQQNKIYLKQQEAQRRYILQQQAEQSRIIGLQNKCKENQIKATKKANKLRESLISSSDNIFTQFGDAQIETIESQRDIECLRNIN